MARCSTTSPQPKNPVHPLSPVSSAKWPQLESLPPDPGGERGLGRPHHRFPSGRFPLDCTKTVPWSRGGHTAWSRQHRGIRANLGPVATGLHPWRQRDAPNRPGPQFAARRPTDLLPLPMRRRGRRPGPGGRPRTPHSVTLLNRYPYNNGHLLVAPRSHVGRLNALTPEQQLDLTQTISQMVLLLEKVLQPQGFNIGLNLGRRGGGGRARPSPLAHRSSLGRRHELHAGAGRDSRDSPIPRSPLGRPGQGIGVAIQSGSTSRPTQISMLFTTPPPDAREPYKQCSAALRRSSGEKFFGGKGTVATPTLRVTDCGPPAC